MKKEEKREAKGREGEERRRWDKEGKRERKKAVEQQVVITERDGELGELWKKAVKVEGEKEGENFEGEAV
jgi:hypothetical protein